MEIAMKEGLFLFMLDNVINSNKKILDALTITKTSQHVSIIVNNKYADKIRDLAIEKQQIVGFDRNYELTEYGKMLDDIIDIFYC